MPRPFAAAAALAALAAAPLLAPAASPAAFPGKPGPIAYSIVDYEETGEGSVTGTGGLYVPSSQRGEERRQLTTDLGDHSPAYSRDGRLIVFVNEDEEARTNGIYVMRRDGTERTLVIAGGRGAVGHPYFFPSGKAIAFSRSVGGHSHIFSIRTDGSGLRRLTRGPHDNYDPVVAPNGRRIAFVSDRDRDGRRDRSDILSMRRDGSHVRVLIDGPRNEMDPDISPNGRRIAFVSNRRAGQMLYVARAGGRRVRQLTRCPGATARCHSKSDPAFSPNGRYIVFLSSGTRTSSIDVVRTDGRGFGGTVDSGGIEEEGFGSTVGPPTWGPRPRQPPTGTTATSSSANLPLALSGSPSG